MNKFFSKINNNNIWILLFFIVLLIHLIYAIPSGDEITFFGTVNMWPSNMTFMEVVINRYMTWSSRFFSDWLTYFFAQHFFLFKILNSVVCTLFIYLIYKLVGRLEKNSSFNTCLICIFFVCMYPWKDMESAGIATTMIFYLWPFTALLYVIYILIKYNNNNKLSIKEYIIYSISLIFSVTVEQTVTYIIIFSLMFIGYNIKNKIKNTMNVYTFIVSILGLIFILICPGLLNRFVIELGWYSTYEMLSFMDKLSLGINSTMFHFIKVSDAMILYLFFLIGLLIVVWNKYIDKYYCILMMFNFIWIIIGLHINVNDSIVVGMETFKMIDGMNIISFSGYLPTLISILLLLWPCIGLYLVYNENNKKCFIMIFIYLFSFFDRIIMGFSPTIFASSTRTYLPVFIMLILLNCIIYIKIFNKNRI